VLQDANFDITVVNRGSRLVPGTTQVIANRNKRDELEVAAAGLPDFDVLIDTSCYTRRQSQLAVASFGKKTDHWIHLSSAAVYLDPRTEVPNESALIGGTEMWGAYGQNKADVDEALLELGRDLKITILRPPYLYGPANAADREAHIWSRLLRGRPVLIPGDGTAPVQFLHVSDLARAVLTVALYSPAGGIVYNVGPGYDVTLAEFVGILARVSECVDSSLLVGPTSGSVGRVDYFPFQDIACRVDDSRFRRDCGWRSAFTVEAGFADTLLSHDRAFLQARLLDTRAEDRILKSFGDSRP
jgi:dTDP-glucose 4,6-dehydratase